MKEKQLEKIKILDSDLIEALRKDRGIESVKELEKASERAKMESFSNIDNILQEKILVNIEVEKEPSSKKLFGRVAPVVERLIENLRNSEYFEKVEPVGSFRRKCPDFDEVDLAAVLKDRQNGLDYFGNLDCVKKVLERDDRKFSILRDDGLKVNLFAVGEDNYGFSLVKLTGSDSHYSELREVAREYELTIDIDGLWTSKDEKIPIEIEEEFYKKIGMEFVPPELRENEGEIDAAKDGNLPNLVEFSEVKGDLQVHTDFSDGENTVEEMARKGAKNGLEYLLITDHAHYFKEDGKWSRDLLEKQGEEIERVNEKLDIEVIQGIEADIERNGLNIPDSWIDEVEILCAGLHGDFQEFTPYILSSFESYPVDIFVHPFDRTLPENGQICYDLEEVVEKAKKEDVAIEISAQPTRLNFDWRNVKKYREEVDYVISTDAHSLNQLDYHPFGVSQARKGWCEKSNIVNTLPIDDLLEYFRS